MSGIVVLRTMNFPRRFETDTLDYRTLLTLVRQEAADEAHVISTSSRNLAKAVFGKSCGNFGSSKPLQRAASVTRCGADAIRISHSVSRIPVRARARVRRRRRAQ
jgi:hypothetical protein